MLDWGGWLKPDAETSGVYAIYPQLLLHRDVDAFLHICPTKYPAAVVLIAKGRNWNCFPMCNFRHGQLKSLGHGMQDILSLLFRGNTGNH